MQGRKDILNQETQDVFEWDLRNFRKFIGLEIDQIGDLRNILSMAKSKKFEKQNIEYLTWPEFGVSLELENRQLKNIYLYFMDKLFKKFAGSLPYNFTSESTNDQVVGFLGEPDKKTGGKTEQISLSYERLGVQFDFITKVWESTGSPLAMIVLFRPEIEVCPEICGLCRKPSTSRCSNCKLVNYCSEKCQTSHWKLHKSYCKLIKN